MIASLAVNGGYVYPRILETLTRLASSLAVVSLAFHSDDLGPFLERTLAQRSRPSLSNK